MGFKTVDYCFGPEGGLHHAEAKPNVHTELPGRPLTQDRTKTAKKHGQYNNLWSALGALAGEKEEPWRKPCGNLRYYETYEKILTS